MRRLSILLTVLALVIAACGDDDGAETTEAPAATSATTAAPTTTAATTTTTAAPTTVATQGFTADDLMTAVLMDGDPWVIPITDAVVFEITIDDIWPLEGGIVFPDEHAVYEAAEFETGSFGFYGEPDGGSLVLTAAHLFATPDGAEAAFEIIEASFSNAELIGVITGMAEGAITESETLGAPSVGDRAVAVRAYGDEMQVFGVIWITENLLQFVRTSMLVDDAERVAATVAIAKAMADRLGS